MKELYLLYILQVICALGLINVWIVRNRKSTIYRGGNSKNLKEEFQEYGLPVWFYYFIGFLKIGSAIALVIGIWQNVLVLPTAILIFLLMLGALSMHFKVHDPLKKSLPAFLMLMISAALILGSIYIR